jgi:hypothetical protein
MTSFQIALVFASVLISGCKSMAPSAKDVGHTLVADSVVDEYMGKFARQELLATGKASPSDQKWFRQEIPRLELPDKAIEEMYYFRWYAFAKHIYTTRDGWVITEFKDPVPWAGKFNTISASAGLQLREARWLRNPNVAEQYAYFWGSKDASPRLYSFPFADSVRAVAEVTGNAKLEEDLLPVLVKNYEHWEASNFRSVGLFWQIDDRDGMEYSAGGSGYRPSINAYMYGDAKAIALIAKEAGRFQLASEFEEKAAKLANRVHLDLWNANDSFYETRNKSFQFVHVRELIGYLPWYFGLARPSDEIAWLQLNDHNGFKSPFGYTTVERRSSLFMLSNRHECTWNGPVWPFAMTQTLMALANMLDSTGEHVLPPASFLEGLRLYTREQHLTLPDGDRIPWIDEDTDPDTGLWLARAQLKREHRPDQNRGQYYNHSGYADLIISDLIGIRPQSGNVLAIAPLVDPGWDFYALEDVPYHGHLLSVYFDRGGQKYHLGKGLVVLEDGQVIGRSSGTAMRVELAAH